MIDKTFLMLSLVLTALLLSSPHPSIADPISSCLAYEPAEVKLTGRLTRETFPGRPNYESIKNGDEPETVWVLKVDKPFCARDAKGQNDPEDQVKLIQLVVSRDSYEEKQDLVGKKIAAEGTLFHGLTGHHHTPVLMTVQSLKPL